MDARTQHRQVQINIYIHRFIETHRRYFGEPDCEILERAIRSITGDIEQVVPGSTRALSTNVAIKRNANGAGEQGSRSYSRDGYLLEHGEQLKMEYNGRIHKAQIMDGAWLTENKTICHSPSAAANDVARTKEGEKTQLNGLLYWRVLREGEWIPLKELADKKRLVEAFRDEDF